MPRPIALLTDFGWQDAYVGVMKGVLLSRCPDVRWIDLTHGVPPGDIRTGSLLLASAVPYCPADTLFLAVVDPGVGGERRPICLRAGGRLFVGPDNGLLWPAAASAGPPEAFQLDRPAYWLPHPGATFHGRDIFAPVAARLASGTPPEALGSPVADPVRLELPACAPLPDGAAGEVLLIDRFGNAVTNIRPEDAGDPPPGAARFEIPGASLAGPATHYGAAPPGEPVVVVDSFGFYEIAVNRGNAAERFGLRPGTPVTVRRLARDPVRQV